MKHELELEIAGLGIVIYSPWVMESVAPGSDLLERELWQPEDVARNVVAGRMAAFATGGPGSYRMSFDDGPLDERELERATYKVRLCLEVREPGAVVRDLYDFLSWDPSVAEEQRLPLGAGFYRLTVFSSPPASGIIGDGQRIFVHLERVDELPVLRHEGVPLLCDEDE